MIDAIRSEDPIRSKIEALGTTLSLPTVRKALGVLEGAHASDKRFGADDVMDIRIYEPGDEAKRIDWKTSARVGRPMVVQRERPSTSRAWLLLDVGQEMTGTCVSGEQVHQVAANALCMFAALSLRRGDEVSIVFGDSGSITRVPFNGGLTQFEQTLDNALQRDWNKPRNIDALLEYARPFAGSQGPIRWCSSMSQPLIRSTIAMRATYSTRAATAAFRHSCAPAKRRRRFARIANICPSPSDMS